MSETNEIDLLEENEEIEKPTIQKKKTAFVNPAPKVVIKKKVVVKVATPPESEEEDDGGSAPQRQTKDDAVDSRAGAKPRRERTQKQIDAFNRCIEKKKEKAKERADEAKRLAEYDKKALEEKVVKKAISIKKKQIKKQLALDEISDDDTPIEKIKEVVKKTIAPVVKPKTIFKFM